MFGPVGRPHRGFPLDVVVAIKDRAAQNAARFGVTGAERLGVAAGVFSRRGIIAFAAVAFFRVEQLIKQEHKATRIPNQRRIDETGHVPVIAFTSVWRPAVFVKFKA